jgi:hypothetical protein
MGHRGPDRQSCRQRANGCGMAWRKQRWLSQVLVPRRQAPQVKLESDKVRRNTVFCRRTPRRHKEGALHQRSECLLTKAAAHVVSWHERAVPAAIEEQQMLVGCVQGDGSNRLVVDTNDPTLFTQLMTPLTSAYHIIPSTATR